MVVNLISSTGGRSVLLALLPSGAVVYGHKGLHQVPKGINYSSLTSFGSSLHCVSCSGCLSGRSKVPSDGGPSMVVLTCEVTYRRWG